MNYGFITELPRASVSAKASENLKSTRLLMDLTTTICCDTLYITHALEEIERIMLMSPMSLFKVIMNATKSSEEWLMINV